MSKLIFSKFSFVDFYFPTVGLTFKKWHSHTHCDEAARPILVCFSSYIHLLYRLFNTVLHPLPRTWWNNSNLLVLSTWRVSHLTLSFELNSSGLYLEEASRQVVDRLVRLIFWVKKKGALKERKLGWFEVRYVSAEWKWIRGNFLQEWCVQKYPLD